MSEFKFKVSGVKGVDFHIAILPSTAVAGKDKEEE